jgi:hypothetical protein
VRTIPSTLPTPAVPGPRRSIHRQPWVPAAAVILLYALLSLAAYWPILPGQGGRIPTCACGDPALQTWFLRWIPYAISHGHNPLFTTWTNYPLGVNLAQNTEMPLLGILVAPLTLLVSPIASYNLLLWLAFPASAGSMFLVLRRWTGSVPAAFVGGLLYGFSAYTVGQGVGHAMLSFVPLPPLFFFQLHKLIVRQGKKPYRDGLVLGAIAVAQYFIEPEVLATLTLMAAFAVILLLVFNWGAATRAVILYSLRGLASSAALVVVFVAYPLWFTVLGPQHFKGAVRPVINQYHIDLLGPLVPTYSQRFAPSSLLGLGEKLGNVENGSYIGLPLLLLTAWLVVRYRRNRWIVLSAALASIAFVLSLGPRLGVWNHATSFPLPLALLVHLPLLDDLVPARLSLFEILFVSVLVALGLSEALLRLPIADTVHRQFAGLRRPSVRLFSSGLLLLGLVAVVSLIPRWPYVTVSPGVPAFFRSSGVKQIPLDSVVLTYPFPYYPDNQAMMWQAISDMRFKEVGTYALVPNAQGTAVPIPTTLHPPSVEAYLVRQEDALATNPPLSPAGHGLIVATRLYLKNYGITTVIADQSGTNPQGTTDVTRLFADALGRPRMTGGVAVWFDVPSLLRQAH